MKFSERWLREWVDPPLTTDELAEQLTMAGLEVESVDPVAARIEGVVVGEVVEVSAHPNADSLHLCRVATGTGEPERVVCGAPNVRAGFKYPFAPVGASLDGAAIKKAKLRGEESFGMLCSERELGISDDHSGLMELPGDAPVGADIVEYLALRDTAIDLDLTPNRSDCLGMVGLAREVGVLNDLPVTAPEFVVVPPQIEETFPIVIEAGEACPRYVGRVVRGIDLNAETPLWMSERLRRSGLRSIDPVVDVTNYVMLELGQPLHAFDLGKLSGRVVVRMAREGEQITLLDGKEIALRDDTLLITDESGPIAIAGVMGGLSTAVDDSTTDLFLESAFFAPLALSGIARSYAMNTDASHRFERGVDHEIQVRAIERATELLLEIAGGTAGPVSEVVSAGDLPAAVSVRLRSGRVRRLLGVEVPEAEIDRLLTQLGLEHEKNEENQDITWKVTSPSHRFDIAIEADLIEEISRIYGYNNLPESMPKADLAIYPIAEAEITLREVRDYLVARGYFEAINYSFVDNELQTLLDPVNEPIDLANPLSPDLSVMRTTLWTGLLKSLIYNKNRQQERVRLFESGLRFQRPPNVAGFDMADIRQEPFLAGVACGARQPESWSNARDLVDFYDVKGDLEGLFRLTADPASFRFEAASHPALHPGQTAAIRRGGELVGHLGLLHPRIQQQLDIAEPVYLFELDWERMRQGRLPEHRELSRFPAVRRDIAVIVDRELRAEELANAVRESAGDALQNLKLFDVYQGKGIDPTRKSVAMGLTFQHPSRTLTDEEINEFVQQVVQSLSERFGASLRN